MIRIAVSILFCFLLLTLFSSCVTPPPTPDKIVNLRCEYLASPLGIDQTHPRLSWMLESIKRGEQQTAYQILVASSPELLAKDEADLWDTGKIESPQSNQIEYAGKPLTSQMVCHWKVRVWTSAITTLQTDVQPLVSLPAKWSMGLLNGDDWKAEWIALGNMLPDEALAWPALDKVRWIWQAPAGQKTIGAYALAARRRRRVSPPRV